MLLKRKLSNTMPETPASRLRRFLEFWILLSVLNLGLLSNSMLEKVYKMIIASKRKVIKMKSR
jgi:hypothetical protein